MRIATTSILVLACVFGSVRSAQAQRAPEVGYVFPPGGKAGTTINVQIGGYDWTPDMEFFVHDKRVQLVPTGPLGPILIPGPPYWFGAKGRLVSLPLARELPAKFVLPADVPPGAIRWQAVNANGSTSAGTFIVSNGLEIVENENHKEPQLLSSVPATVSGRLFRNEEVDHYRFVAPKDGPITVDVMARRLGAKFLGIVEIHDGKGLVIADALGTSGADPVVTFAAKAGVEYAVSIRDIDFGGDRSYVYRLAISPGPRVVGAIPAVGKHGETREVEFVGVGIASGAAQLESIKRQVTFPPSGSAFDYRLETPWGAAPPFSIGLDDLGDARGTPSWFTKAGLLIGPAGITGVFDQLEAEDVYSCNWKKGEVWSLAVQAKRLSSPLDVALSVRGPDGKELARNDDLPGTTDAGLDFTVPADGVYQVVVAEMSGKAGTRAAIYRLVVRQPASDFSLQAPAQKVSVPLGGKFDLAIRALRTGGFKAPIILTVEGLPPGITAPPNLQIAGDKSDLVVPLTAAKDAAIGAGLIKITGKAMVGGAAVTRLAEAPTTALLPPRNPDESRFTTIMAAAVFKPLFKGRPVDQDTGRKVPRGSTFPADVLVERLDGFQGEVTLQMAATQSYQMQGITGGDVVVPPGVTKAIYPCYMPEWLETTRTSRMGMIAVAKVADPKGKVRYVVNDITGYITMTMEGALLKVSTAEPDMTLPAGQPFDVRVKVARLASLKEPVRLELRTPDELAGQFKADSVMAAPDQDTVVLRVTPAATLRGLCSFSIRGTAMQDGKYPAISEANVSLELLPTVQAPR